ncbi:C-C chemokine receptor type 10 isoform X2 [Scleropages formosus]|uniref:Chemokine (C-C motif) receptor 10 n=2 Tax=Scleropages formosus TaxID=113540 RepID=A0A8C9R0W1_SCLFO|nr:C-C chemokine receptor type 7-like isoform X2 [Scleropages formosus]XP_018597647.1 C-C chemokine receptor type 7-like isoform X2 [Scleropages formosus]
MGEITTYADNVTDFYMESYSDYTVTLEELCESSHSQALLIKVVQLCIFSVVFLVGILGNMLVIATFALYRRLRLRCMTDVFLLHLAVSDLLLLLTLPLQAADTLLDRWEFGSILCKVMRGLYAVNTYSGLLLLACISVDRYVVIVQTRAAQRLRHYHLLYSSLAAICVWFTAGLLSLPEIISVGVDTQKLEQRCEHQLEWKIKIATWATQIAGFCLPFLAMLVCYSLIGRTLLQGQGWRRQRTLRLLLVLVLVFLVFQLPYTIVLSLKMAKNSHNNPGNACEHWKATLIAEYITCSLAYMRCCLNPLLYALVGVRFRNDVLRLLHDVGCIRWGPCGRSLVSASDSCVSTSATSPLPTVKSVMGSTSEQLLSPAPSIQMNFTTSPVY